MAQVERQKEERGAGKRAKAKEGRARRASAQGNFELTPPMVASLAALIVAAAYNDGAVRVGLTRDGGALAVGMYMGDDYATEYIRPSEDFNRAVEEIAEAWLPNGATDLEWGFQKIAPK